MRLCLVLVLLLLGPGIGRAAATLEWEATSGGRRALLVPTAAAAPGLRKMEQTGILFTNALTPERLLESQVRYNGCGVAAGDVDGDGLCDLFFCSLEGRSHLYKNLGGFKFKEITDEAGVACAGLLTSGAVLVDVDGDGSLDLLVNAYENGTRLFLNDGRGHFTEKQEAGLARKFGASSMALADIDGNGTLDLYVANYATTALADHAGMKFTVQRKNGKLVVVAAEGRPVEGNPELEHQFIVDESTGDIKQNGEPDILYLNLGNGRFEAQSWTGGRFLDEEGKPLTLAPHDWGLSAAFRDFNGDGLPDLYVCNDLFTPDRAWINQGNGQFRAASNLAIRKMSEASMGVDFGDLNRDGIDDFLTSEMLSRDHRMRTMQVAGLRGNSSRPGEINNRPSYNRNMLFLGRGDGTFAEVAHLAGLEASDWTWMPVFLDVDLDGYEDVLFVTGFFRDSLNADLVGEMQKRKGSRRLSAREQLELQLKVFPLHQQPNVAFRNRGDLTFEDVSDRWGFNEVGISQGLCLADLDNDGDPDVVVNKFGAPPSVYRNEAAAPRVAVRLKGLSPNTRGIGAKIQFRGGPVPQSQEMMAGGRYLSGDEAERVFACGNSPGPFTIEVAWRSGRRSVVTNAPPNYLYEVDEAQAQTPPPAPAVTAQPLFKDVSDSLKHVHRETLFDDFARQPLLSRKLSQAGPGLAWVDLDDDGWPDLVISGGRGGEMGVFRNDGKGGFQRVPVPAPLRALKTEQGAVAGIPGKGGARLLASQSNYEGPASNSVALMMFKAGELGIVAGLPAMESCPGPVALADVDGDGVLDLFVGGRVIPGKYPMPATSMLYRGTPAGGFVVDAVNSAALKNVGLVNGAIFADLDGDGWPELVLAQDWGPLRVFHNEKGRLKEITREMGLDKFSGWWNGVAAGDFDGDGRLDLVASNWGRNTKYERYRPAPLRVYYGDWNGDGEIELLEAGEDLFLKKTVCLRRFDPVREALPWVAGRLFTYAAFGGASIQEILGERLAKAGSREATTLESTVFLNRGDHFEARPLPLEAQFAPAFGVCVADFDGDGREDIVLAQNFYPVDLETSRYDAGRGLWLRGDGKGGFAAMSGQASGLQIYGDQRGAAVCDYDKDGRVDLVVSQNGGVTKLYHNENGVPGLRVTLVGGEGNPAGYGAQLRLVYSDGPGPVREVHGGSGYWSQDGATQVLGRRATPRALWVRWPGGKTVTYDLKPSAVEVIAHESGEAETK
jgi:hypothetical protein